MFSPREQKQEKGLQAEARPLCDAQDRVSSPSTAACPAIRAGKFADERVCDERRCRGREVGKEGEEGSYRRGYLGLRGGGYRRGGGYHRRKGQ